MAGRRSAAPVSARRWWQRCTHSPATRVRSRTAAIRTATLVLCSISRVARTAPARLCTCALRGPAMTGPPGSGRRTASARSSRSSSGRDLSHGAYTGPVLILPPGHAQAPTLARRFSRREKWMVGSVLASVAVLTAIVIFAVSSGGHSSARGCVDVTIPYSLGGQEIYKCGAQARLLCASVGSPTGFTGAAGRAVAAECRKAGVPVGGPR